MKHGGRMLEGDGGKTCKTAPTKINKEILINKITRIKTYQSITCNDEQQQDKLQWSMTT